MAKARPISGAVRAEQGGTLKGGMRFGAEVVPRRGTCADGSEKGRHSLLAVLCRPDEEVWREDD